MGTFVPTSTIPTPVFQVPWWLLRHTRLTSHPEPHLLTADMSVTFGGGMWIWQSARLLASANEVADLIAASNAARITDLYLYTPPRSYSERKGQLQPFIANATAADIRVWALDGDRGYLDDAAGPGKFLQGIEDLIDYNQAVSANERFIGIQADI